MFVHVHLTKYTYVKSYNSSYFLWSRGAGKGRRMLEKAQGGWNKEIREGGRDEEE